MLEILGRVVQLGNNLRPAWGPNTYQSAPGAARDRAEADLAELDHLCPLMTEETVGAGPHRHPDAWSPKIRCHSSRANRETTSFPARQSPFPMEPAFICPTRRGARSRCSSG